MFANRKLWFSAAAGIVLLILALSGWYLFGRSATTPRLSVVTPPRVSLSAQQEVVVDVTISDLGNTLYPAASVSIRFDPSRLEFLGVREGNVFVRDADFGQMLPGWSCNPTQCNQTGVINVMYLDLTGGTEAFDRQLLAGEDNVLLRLAFRLRGSASAGDVYDLAVEDAVFAASNEEESLATLHGTLTGRDGRIIVGG